MLKIYKIFIISGKPPEILRSYKGYHSFGYLQFRPAEKISGRLFFRGKILRSFNISTTTIVYLLYLTQFTPDGP